MFKMVGRSGVGIDRAPKAYALTVVCKSIMSNHISILRESAGQEGQSIVPLDFRSKPRLLPSAPIISRQVGM